MSKRFILISAILTSIWIGVEWGMWWLPAILGTVFDISLIALFVTLVRIIITLSTVGFLRYFSRSFLFCGSILGAISSILMLFAFIANSFPGSLSEIHMTNGKRQIVFMQMSHIGTQEYYDTVNHTLENLSASGYAIYREWVRPGTQENTDRFDRTLGVKISSGTYADFASLVWLVAQDDQIFSRTRSGSVHSVDLTLDQIITLMGTGGSVPSESPMDPSRELQSLRNSHTGPLFGYIIRGLMNFSLSYVTGTDIALEAMDPALRDAILTKRNNHLVETFLADNTTDVVIVYGALHFEWVYSILRSKDPEWKILSIKPYYPYKK